MQADGSTDQSNAQDDAKKLLDVEVLASNMAAVSAELSHLVETTQDIRRSQVALSKQVRDALELLDGVSRDIQLLIRG
ncbi:MAG: hypothetical protein M3198_16420 [Actinomycetota bacterium]|nr:hypothetical protein [Actinomycetota bacterium]